MKKRFSLCIAILFLFGFACAESEITFQKIPWMSDDAYVLQSLTDEGYIRNGVSFFPLSSESPLYIVEDDTGFVSPNRIMGVENVTFVADLNGMVKGDIAGYPVKNLFLTFAYNGAYQLISVNVVLLNAQYDDLRSKLISIYGEGEQKNTEEGLESNVWKGNDSSAILLYTQSEGFDYTLMYGRLDATTILKNCLIPNQEDTSGL